MDVVTFLLLICLSVGPSLPALYPCCFGFADHDGTCLHTHGAAGSNSTHDCCRSGECEERGRVPEESEPRKHCQVGWGVC